MKPFFIQVTRDNLTIRGPWRVDVVREGRVISSRSCIATREAALLAAQSDQFYWWGGAPGVEYPPIEFATTTGAFELEAAS
ncbi:MAG: hypothetical protein AB7I42_24135 [Bradyrhizobium sp.]|uniref:hypothetical protein n=1 Tax=Bradyrhizobium sp. TaxID=376 RepID=UPI003D0B8627